MAQHHAGARLNPIHVQKFLGGIHYPVGKQGICDTARKGGADAQVLGALERIPDQEYSNPADVSRALGQLD